MALLVLNVYLLLQYLVVLLYLALEAQFAVVLTHLRLELDWSIPSKNCVSLFVLDIVTTQINALLTL